MVAMTASSSGTTLVQADRVLTGDADLGPGWVEHRGAAILAVGAGTPARPPDHRIEGTLVPGFVDTHVHGGGGASFGDGDPEPAVAFHRSHGTTTLVASLVSAPLDVLQRQVRLLSDLVDEGLLAGVHLEGPWLATDFCGAHDPAVLRDPEPADVARLLTAGAGTIRSVTLAPERPGALDAIRRIVDAGAVAAVGHTGATYATTRAAVAAGARVATHLFNAMPPAHHREPGPALALLEDERCSVELIADGVHLHGAVVRRASAGAARPVLVSDAMAAAGQPDGVYRVGEREVVVTDGRARLASSGAIAGSTIALDAAVRHAVGTAGVPLVRAVAAATRTPATLLGRSDIGVLAPGARADAVVLDGELRVSRVLHGGRWL